jgi:pilus assembly protein CpaF
MSYAIVISEKGGQERREVFDKAEVTIGRVQGNDLLLAKGNVSKRHARIVCRDGRFIVTDLKSTNGSYVNGHRINQPTIIRESDKIYIGDFVIRIEGAGVAEGIDRVSDVAPSRPDRLATADRLASAEPPANSDNSVAEESTGEPSKPAPRIVPPTLASADRSALNRSSTGPGQQGAAPLPATMLNNYPTVSPAAGPQNPMHELLLTPSKMPLPPLMSLTSSRTSAVTPLAMLIDRLFDRINLDEGDSFAPASEAKRTAVERVLREEIKGMQIPAGEADNMVRAAMREALSLGPLVELMDDNDVMEIRISRFDTISVVREGTGPATLPIGFSSEFSLRRAVGRMAHESGIRWTPEPNSSLNVALPFGAHLTVLTMPGKNTVALIRKPRKADPSLSDLVKVESITPAIQSLLQACLTARTNILLIGPVGSGCHSLLSALTSETQKSERVIVLNHLDLLTPTRGTSSSFVLPDLGQRGAQLVSTVASLRPDRLALCAFHGEVALAALDAIGAGIEGVIGIVRGPSTELGVQRLVTSMASARNGLNPETAASWLSASFEMVIEMERLDGDHKRVRRIAEVIGTDGSKLKLREIFGESDGAKALQPTGAVPALVATLRARGTTVDESIFRRG